MSGQAPVMQGLMGNYLEQSKNLFVQMQEQMQKQGGCHLPWLPGWCRPRANRAFGWV